MYSYLVNALYERILDIFGIIGVPEGYRCKHYQPFILIRRWTNFFKHPKAFGWLVHHPTYCSQHTREEVDARKQGDRKEVKIIDDEFVDKYYTSEDKSKGIVGALKDFENNIVVVLPHIGQVTTGICDALSNFVDVVTKNPVYMEMLRDRSVIANYYQQPTTTTTVTTTTTTTPAPETNC